MNYLLAALAGIIQGLTEFLPVSSTGHLIIFERLFGVSQAEFGLAFDASLHLGTLVAVVIFFWKDYLSALSQKNQLLGKLIIGTIPAAAIGFVFENMLESSIRQLWIVGAALILFSFVIILAEKYSKNTKTIGKISFKESLLIGLFQSIALIPGVSRSGATISGGLFLNMDKKESARFAFMLSGPVIAGAGAKKFLEVIFSNGGNQADLNFFLIGMTFSAIVGYLTIKYFLKYLSLNSLKPFVIYRVVLGVTLIFLSLYLGF